MNKNKKSKSEVMTFKVDANLSALLKEIPNRSEFIRAAVASALESNCPLCGGSGFLSPDQKRHWDRFSRQHAIRECGDCHEKHLICNKGLA